MQCRYRTVFDLNCMRLLSLPDFPHSLFAQIMHAKLVFSPRDVFLSFPLSLSQFGIRRLIESLKCRLYSRNCWQVNFFFSHMQKSTFCLQFFSTKKGVLVDFCPSWEHYYFPSPPPFYEGSKTKLHWTFCAAPPPPPPKKKIQYRVAFASFMYKILSQKMIQTLVL